MIRSRDSTNRTRSAAILAIRRANSRRTFDRLVRRPVPGPQIRARSPLRRHRRSCQRIRPSRPSYEKPGAVETRLEFASIRTPVVPFAETPERQWGDERSRRSTSPRSVLRRLRIFASRPANDLRPDLTALSVDADFRHAVRQPPAHSRHYGLHAAASDDIVPTSVPCQWRIVDRTAFRSRNGPDIRGPPVALSIPIPNRTIRDFAAPATSQRLRSGRSRH